MKVLSTRNFSHISMWTLYVPWWLLFGRPLQVTVCPMLQDHCPVCLSCLSETLVYCGQTVAWIKMLLGTKVASAHTTLCNRPEGQINRDSTWGIMLKGRATLLLCHGYTRSRPRSDSDQSSDSTPRVPRPASAAAEQVTRRRWLVNKTPANQPAPRDATSH